MSSIPIQQGKGKKKGGKKGGKGHQEHQEQMEEEKDGLSLADTNSTTITEKSGFLDTEAKDGIEPGHHSQAQILDPAPQTDNTNSEASEVQQKPSEEVNKPETTPSPAPAENTLVETTPAENGHVPEEPKQPELTFETPKEADPVPEDPKKEPVKESPEDTPAPVQNHVEPVEVEQPVVEKEPVVVQVQEPVNEQQSEPIVFEEKKPAEVETSHSHIVVPEDSNISQENTSESFIKIGQSSAPAYPSPDTVVESPVKTTKAANTEEPEEAPQTLMTSEVIRTEYEPNQEPVLAQSEENLKTTPTVAKDTDLKPATAKEPEEIAEKKPIQQVPEVKKPEAGKKPAHDELPDTGYGTFALFASIGVLAAAGLLVFLKLRK